ncbi:hypothetical protein [Thermocoleostomius sinensis]|jgi:hypothetical protein|uniref:Uncharacterized protein n=1 Tax=Thermocoleostomius sinensis A174 TaxID=2016057 RepID=A0A9E9C3B6_9CYAN|nr:hypothetical protein [Thermocoleostomius sinensis]WAL58801.1 hypothetical protein OXH18_16685 [Thermocoleostomius sinensis A174]
MTRNIFVQALGIAASCYLLLRLSGWLLGSLATILIGLSNWTRYTLLPMSEEIAIAVGLMFLLGVAIFSSRSE